MAYLMGGGRYGTKRIIDFMKANGLKEFSNPESVNDQFYYLSTAIIFRALLIYFIQPQSLAN